MSRPCRAKSPIGLVAVVIVCGCGARTSPLPELEGDRITITRGGDSVGTAERTVRETEDGREIVTRQTFRVEIEGTRARTVVEETTRAEDRQGNTISVRHDSIVGPTASVTTAEVGDGIAIVRRRFRDDVRTETLALPADLRFDNGGALLRAWKAGAATEIEFHTLDVRAPLIERVVYSVTESVGPDNGPSFLRLAYAGTVLRSIATIHLDESGRVSRSDQPLFGSSIETTADSDVTTDDVISTNPVRSSLVRSPYRISREALEGHIRYRFGTEFAELFEPPATGEQRVQKVPGGFIVDICGDCGPGLDASAAALAAALEPTFWLEADHPLLRRIGDEVRNSDGTDTGKMNRLEQWARGRMNEIDFAGHLSAAQALSRRAGDCTEGAVVLAALGRAAGIPTLVASGIVYSRAEYHGVSNVFTPHAWTLAYVDGEWKSFDMSLDGFDASHIAFAVGNGDPGSIQAGHQLAALMSWDAMSEVRPRPAVAGD